MNNSYLILDLVLFSILNFKQAERKNWTNVAKLNYWVLTFPLQMKNVQYEPDLGPLLLLLLQLCVFYNCFLLLGAKIVFSTSPAKQSLVGILQISTPLADCSCSNKVKTNKQTK